MTYSDYITLKQQLEQSVNEVDYEPLLIKLKLLFYNDINSPRRAEMINSITDLLRILEIRDVLSENDVSSLKEIADRLPNKCELLHKIQTYENYSRDFTKDVEHVTQNCNNSHESISSVQNGSVHDYNQNEHIKDKIYEIVIEEIGGQWRDLGRNLKVKEHIIDDIDKNSNTHSDKALKILKKFDDTTQTENWFNDLCCALEKSRRRDLSILIKEISMAKHI